LCDPSNTLMERVPSTGLFMCHQSTAPAPPPDLPPVVAPVSQSLCQHQGFLLWCLLMCVIMWFERIQRKWYFLHKPYAYWPRLFRRGLWSSWGMRVFTWGLTSSPEVGRWQEGLWHGLFFLVLIFFSLPLVSDGALCHKVTFIWCRTNLNSSWSWNDWNRIRVHTHILCPCVCVVCLPTWFLYLTSELLIDFSCYF